MTTTTSEIINDINNMSLTRSTIKIMVLGGSFGGKSFLNSFISKLDSSPLLQKTRFDITLCDPRAGFINILAIPRSIMNPSFAKQTYATDIELPFDKPNDKYNLKFIHGALTKLLPNSVDINLVKNDELSSSTINENFDYCVVATGRSRPWPFDPKGYTKQKYLAEMDESYEKISNSQIISIIGAGAVGIETAAELVHEFPQKKIILVHPYDNLPPELLDDDFKLKIKEKLIDLGVDLKMGTRLAKETEEGFYTTTGEFIKSDLILWCGSKKNNLSLLLNSELVNCVDQKKMEICINNKLQLIENYSDMDPFGDDAEKFVAKYENIFAVGDVTKFPVIKAAGGAFVQANTVATNLFNKFAKFEKNQKFTDTVDVTTEEETEIEKEASDLLNNEQTTKEDEVLKDEVLKPWPNGMLMLVGPGYLIKNRDGEITINEELNVKVYDDFCNGFVSTYYKVVFEGVDKWE